MNTPTDTAGLVAKSLITFEELLATAPDAEPNPEFAPDTGPPQPPRKTIWKQTGLPERYREEWPLPDDAQWLDRFAKARGKLDQNGTLALIGPRGTGKTRMAAELMRLGADRRDRYVTAMGLFLRIRKSFSKDVGDTEADIVDEMAECPLLVLDEIQERGNTRWEDRIITHILDRRYGDLMPTVIIANLTKETLADCLGESIVSRMQETGGVMEITGKSHRIHP